MPSMFGSQTIVTGGHYQQFNNDSKGPWDLLVKATSPAAFHNSRNRRDPPKCHPNTRFAVLKHIMDWIHGLDPASQTALIMWLYGPAGAGKSAIAQSIAELCYEEGILMASYFFSRFDSTRNHERSLIATIAYQASLCIPNFRECIKAAIDHDPLIFSRSLSVQMSTPVVQPLQDCINVTSVITTTWTDTRVLRGGVDPDCASHDFDSERESFEADCSRQLERQHIVRYWGNLSAVYQRFQRYTRVLGAWDRLVKAASPAAFHNSGDRRDPPKCHPNTRVAVLKHIMDWIHGLNPATQTTLIMWLYGPAGAGKSAITQSIAELCYEEGILIASYFFSRFDSSRNHPLSLIATIAYQASLCIPNIKERIKASIDHDPLIFNRSLTIQMSTLVIRPLQDYIHSDTRALPRVIIIDGLDECEDRQSQLEILATISKALQQHRLPFIFFIASRPEHDIRATFNCGYLKDITTSVALDDEYRPSDDIHLFLQDSFAEIKETHPFRADIPDTWPNGDILESLVNKSSGQFIYASTVIKFVKSSRHRPPKRLEIVLGLRPVQRDMPFAELDALYMHILSSVEDPEAVLRILAYHFLIPLGYDDVGLDLDLLSLDPGDVVELFCDLTSLVSVNEMRLTKLHVFHASLEDFLLDQSRSQQFWINSKMRHAEFAHLYIHYLNGEFANAELTLEAQVNVITDRPSGCIVSREPEILIHHFDNATATPDLVEDLRQISIWSIFHKSHYLKYFAFFIDYIETMGFENWTELYSHQLQFFDQAAQEIMEQMYTWPNLTALVAIFNLDTENWGADVRVLFQLSNDNIKLDKLDIAGALRFGGPFRQLIREFLANPTRCGIYGLTGKRYAIAAEYFLHYICDHMEHIMQSNYALYHWCYQRQRTKFLSRHISATPNKFPPKKIKQHALRGWKPHRPYLLPRACSAGFCLALRCLSDVLCQADRSEDLIVLARQQMFWSFSFIFPHDTRTARREVVRYLARVDAGEILVQAKKRNGEQHSEQSHVFSTPQSYACQRDCLRYYWN
ncbi:hypothetical protein CVT25_007881 [Psilocybe cyanescens]|uniref:Nephrocystin 3-like N-terminal domain-containing protein n=1 Tax=Psilocybe cyanescens TaxID=93625 RepID=A0A409XJH3_PSICY|nr:hypothetical protein CVT25_007881 [Psilocybe cyanescens]